MLGEGRVLSTGGVTPQVRIPVPVVDCGSLSVGVPRLVPRTPLTDRGEGPDLSRHTPSTRHPIPEL